MYLIVSNGAGPDETPRRATISDCDDIIFNETKLPTNVIEKCYAWVDLQFLFFFTHYLSQFNAFRDFILCLMSYGLLKTSVTCFIASSPIQVVRYAHVQNVYCINH